MTRKERTRGPEEAWDALEKVALDAEVDRVLALPDARLDDELARAGLDPEAVRARGATLADTGARPAKVRSRRALLRRPAVWLPAVAAAAIALLLLRGRAGDVERRRETAAPPPSGAAQIRHDALRACDERRWTECERGLDRARAVDPAGDDSPDVRAARSKIAASRSLPPP